MRTARFLVVLLTLSLAACGGGHGGTAAGGAGAVPSAPLQPSGRATAAKTARIANAAARVEERAFDAAQRATRGTPPNPSNVASADMPVPRPGTTACVVPLFAGLTFADFSPKPFEYSPPTGCRGPWAKVVLEADFSVTAGRQFDRTATIGLGGATIYFGTTAEPSRTLAPSWHVERDLTDLSALFAGPQSGQISIGNVVNTTYTGILGASAKLDFYPADERNPAPRVADVVVPLADAQGNPVGLQTGMDSLSKSFVPPTNVERAYLDVIAQSQGGDEFWYTCFPSDLAALLNNCGNTAFRETEVAVDGRAAGIAPVYPWIYTGGIDPYLWRPIPGVQTLNFTPYRVDLTPFAGPLDSGGTHQVALAVFNANHSFSVTGNLLLFLDRDARGPLAGGIDADTLAAAPAVSVLEGGSFDASGTGHGTIDTSSRREFVIAGHLRTSHGTVRSQVAQTIAFTQHQDVVSSATQFAQNITQRTRIASLSLHEGGGGPASEGATFDWPLTLNFSYVVAADGSAAQTTSVQQGYVAATERSERSRPLFASRLSNSVSPSDTLNFDASGALVGTTNDTSSQTYTYRDTTGRCYGRKLTAAAGAVTGNAAIGC
jgi:Peptide N-acetyl-beta-D-glucosaminyl asparaginase amidase A